MLDLALRVAMRQTGGQREESADVAQEVVIKYLTGDERPADNWEAWVTTVTRNQVIDYHRRQAHLASPDDEGSDDGRAYRRGRFNFGPSAGVNSAYILKETLKVLSDRDRKMLLRHFSGWSNSELAEEFELANANSAGVTLSRIKKRLREEFPELVDEPGDGRLY